jgi:hypothetical protein
MKIPESKRSKVGKIAEFHGILNAFPNLVTKKGFKLNPYDGCVANKL